MVSDHERSLSYNASCTSTTTRLKSDESFTHDFQLGSDTLLTTLVPTENCDSRTRLGELQGSLVGTHLKKSWQKCLLDSSDKLKCYILYKYPCTFNDSLLCANWMLKMHEMNEAQVMQIRELKRQSITVISMGKGLAKYWSYNYNLMVNWSV